MDLSGLSSLTTAATSLSNLILVTPNVNLGYQPQNAEGSEAAQPPSILFHYEGEQSVALESDITDHYIEDNTAIQDQWTLKPETVNTHGFIGELNNVPPKALAILQKAANRLTTISAYVPSLSATALIAYNQAFFLYQVGANAANSAVSAWSSISNSGQSQQTKQQQAFQQFYGYWQSRTLFTVQTPWAIFQNMAIKSLRAIQDAETNVISDFEVSFKRMRFATTESSIPISLQGRAASQSQGLVDFGTTTPTNDIGVLDGISSMGIA